MKIGRAGGGIRGARRVTSFISGFLLSLSLILAIGPQNAFVLRQGLRREHVFWICLICGICDAILITVAVAGFGALAQAAPWFETVMLYAGAAFLFVYGWRNALSAWRGGAALQPEGEAMPSLRKTLLTLLAFTFLNPHVYVDTLVLMGSVSAQYDSGLAFGVGASLASVIFFFVLGYGAGLLQPVFARPVAWRVLDGVIAVTMWAIAIKLLVL